MCYLTCHKKLSININEYIYYLFGYVFFLVYYNNINVGVIIYQCSKYIERYIVYSYIFHGIKYIILKVYNLVTR